MFIFFTIALLLLIAAILGTSKKSCSKNIFRAFRSIIFLFSILGLGLFLGWKIGKTLEENNAVNEVSMKVRWFSEQLTQIQNLDDSVLLDEYLSDIKKSPTALLYDKNHLEMGRDFFIQWDEKIQTKTNTNK